jgi:hypothetical protein
MSWLSAVEGIQGKLGVNHADNADYIRILLFYSNDESVYFVANQVSIEKWLTAFSSQPNTPPAIIEDGNSRAIVMRSSDEYQVITFDIHSAHHLHVLRFTLEQAHMIRVKLQPPA